jgi:hypothetical protein
VPIHVNVDNFARAVTERMFRDLSLMVVIQDHYVANWVAPRRHERLFCRATWVTAMSRDMGDRSGLYAGSA